MLHELSARVEHGHAVAVHVRNYHVVIRVHAYTLRPIQAAVTNAARPKLRQECTGRRIESLDAVIARVRDEYTTLSVDGYEVGHAELGVGGSERRKLSYLLARRRVDADLAALAVVHGQLLVGKDTDAADPLERGGAPVGNVAADVVENTDSVTLAITDNDLV